MADRTHPLALDLQLVSVSTKPLGDRSQGAREMLLCLLRNIGFWVHLSWEEGASLEGTLGSRRIEVLAQKGVIQTVPGAASEAPPRWRTAKTTKTSRLTPV